MVGTCTENRFRGLLLSFGTHLQKKLLSKYYLLSAGNHTHDNNATVHSSSLSAGTAAGVAVAY